MAGKVYQLTPTHLSRAEKRRRALELRVKGYSFQEIAGELGYADSRMAHNVVRDELEAAGVESVEEMRQIEGLRLVRVIRAIWPQIVREDLEAIKTVSQIVRLETGLFGLDAGPEVAAESEARPISIQVDGGDPKRLEELTEEQLLKRSPSSPQSTRQPSKHSWS
jgi:hypothetical protein